MSDLTDDQIIELAYEHHIWVAEELLAFSRAVIAASRAGSEAVPAKQTSPMPEPSRAPLRTQGSLPEVERLAVEAMISIWSIRPQPGTECGEAWEAGAHWGFANRSNIERNLPYFAAQLESTAPRLALEAQQEGAMPPALVERGIERRQHREERWSVNGRRLWATGMNSGVTDLRIADRRQA